MPAGGNGPIEVQQLRDEVRALREELQALKGVTATNTVTLKEVVAKTENNVSKSDLDALKDIEDEAIKRGVGSRYLVSLSGYGMLGYTSALGAGDKSANSFSLSGIGLNLSGTLREDPSVDGDVRYKVSVLGSGSPFSLNAGDVWLAYDIKTSKLELEPDYLLSLSLGQQLIPYGLDNVSSEDQRPTIRTSLYNQTRLAGRDIGLVANGGFFTKVDPPTSLVTPVLGYTLGVFNGAGANKLDNDKGVDTLGRLVLSPFPNYFSTFRNLKFGANWYEGNLGPASVLLPAKRRYGGDVSWLRKPFLLTAEYAHTEDGFSEKVGKDGLFSGDDYIATLFWTPNTLPDFQPWLRFDHFEQGVPDGIAPIGAAGNYSSKNVYSVGMNWFIWQTEPVTRRVYTTVSGKGGAIYASGCGLVNWEDES